MFRVYRVRWDLVRAFFEDIMEKKVDMVLSKRFYPITLKMVLLLPLRKPYYGF